MQETPVIEEYICDFCNKKFQREQSMFKHMCETKRRVHDKDLHGNRIAFQCWLLFYKKNTNSRKEKTYLDFAKSTFYSAFVKFGNYCVDIKVVNVTQFMNWLLDNRVTIDKWTSDLLYSRYLTHYLREEDALDALARSIETTISLAESANICPSDYLRHGNKNRICYKITTGKISPWMLFQSQSGVDFLESLDEEQQRMIFDYINPEQWALKFLKNKETVAQIKDLLKQAGY